MIGFDFGKSQKTAETFGHFFVRFKDGMSGKNVQEEI